MGEYRLKVGDPILLKAQLGDRESDKFVYARVFDEDDNEINDSPVILTYRQDGLYKDDSLGFPDDTEYLIAQYHVFEDSSYTTRATNYPGTFTDVYMSDPESTAIDEIRDIVASIGSSSDLVGEVLEDE